MTSWCEFDKISLLEWFEKELKRIGINEKEGFYTDLSTPWGRFKVTLTEKPSKNDLKMLKKREKDQEKAKM